MPAIAADRAHAALARAAFAADALAAAGCAVAYLLLRVGLGRMQRPDYWILTRAVNIPYATAMLAFLLGGLLLLAWAGAAFARRTVPAPRAAGWAFGLVLATIGGLMLVMSQYRHLD